MQQWWCPPLSPQFVSRPDPSVPAETVARAPLALLSLLSRERGLASSLARAAGASLASFLVHDTQRTNAEKKKEREREREFLPRRRRRARPTPRLSSTSTYALRFGRQKPHTHDGDSPMNASPEIRQKSVKKEPRGRHSARVI